MSIEQEKTAAGRIIDRALAKGYLISVNDGEEWTVKKSSKRREIMDALQSTDSDTLMVRQADGAKVGVIYLVWGNSPDEIVCDHTDKPEICELVAA
ncbi:hypothetical protein ABIF78_007706 [Bradyrhizobium japonicum]